MKLTTEHVHTLLLAAAAATLVLTLPSNREVENSAEAQPQATVGTDAQDDSEDAEVLSVAPSDADEASRPAKLARY